MTGQIKRPNPCSNMNHRRSNAPVGHCPQCGGVVNASVRTDGCEEALHISQRRHQAFFCVHCGLQLIVTR
jgi:predicted nucleic acid-binding Zn ribbon protein